MTDDHEGPATGLLAHADTLRTALLGGGYTVDGVSELLRPQAHAALARGDIVPALRATAASPGPLATLVRLFLLGTAEQRAAVGDALAPYRLDDALDDGLLVADGPERVRAGLDVRPYGAPDAGWYVVSDVGADAARPGAVRPDHVLGVGGASVTLAQATVRRPVGTALDVGTGCGVQALHLAEHASAVTATDRNPRALALARVTAALSGVPGWELLEGDLLAPVAGRRFDLVVSNPPFVVGPRARYVYRDSGLAGDEVCARLVRELPAHLTDGGVAQLLANWVTVAGEPWEDRVRGWLAGTGCDAFVIQREWQDPAEYVAMWLRDSGDSSGADYARLYDEWLAWFDEVGVEGVGFGIVTMRRTDAADPSVVVEEHLQPLYAPLGGELERWFGAVDELRALPRDEDVLGQAFAVAEDVRLEQRARAGHDGWEVAEQGLVQDEGLRRRSGIDGFGAALVGACDGTTPVGTLVDVLASAYELDPAELRPAVVANVRALVREGYLRSVSARSR